MVTDRLHRCGIFQCDCRLNRDITIDCAVDLDEASFVDVLVVAFNVFRQNEDG